LFQGEGQNVKDVDDHLDLCARVNFAPKDFLPGLQLGGSVYSGKSAAADENRDYWGGHLVYDKDAFRFKAEYAQGNHKSISKKARGWYALAAYKFTPEFELVGRYEIDDPDKSTDNDRMKAWTLGVNYYLLKHNSKIQANYVMYDPDEGDKYNEVMVNFQMRI
jgi:predicted porin